MKTEPHNHMICLVAAFLALTLCTPFAWTQPEGAPSAALYDAIHRKDHEALRRALDQKPKLDEVNHYLQTPLTAAVSADDSEAVEMLLKAGASANPSVADPGFRPALSFALQLNNPKSVGLLLDAGAPVALRDSFGYTMFGVAFAKGFSRGKYVEKNRKDQDAVLQLVFDAMTKRGEAHKPVTSTDSVQCLDQALCEACRAGRIDWARKFLDAGANVNTIESGMYTPLISAVIGGDQEIVQLLLARGADAHIALGRQGRSALSHAVEFRPNPSIVRLLLSRYSGKEDELKDFKNSEWVLIQAIRGGSGEVVDQLIKAIGEPNIAAATPHDLLKEAIEFGKPESVESLMKAGVLPGKLKYDQHQTHLELAKARSRVEDTPERRKVVDDLSPPKSDR